MKRKPGSGNSKRSHTKSRTGCLSCKTRKIKCAEERPVCSNCETRELECAYANDQMVEHQEKSLIKSQERLLPRPILSTHPATVTFLDLRLFHHFLMVAYPHLPAGNDIVWTMEIPMLAERNEYLMHAMLGLGASHLYRVDPQPRYKSSAVAHRGHAIAGLNRAITRNSLERNEVDVMLAVAYALTFQAQYMEDGWIDFMTGVRGCALVTQRITAGNVDTSFDLRPDVFMTTLEPGISCLSAIDKDIINTGLEALSRLSPILQTQIDLEFFFALKKALQSCLVSTKQGFVEFSNIYQVFFSTDSLSFNNIINTSNQTAQILSAFFTTLQLLMAPVTQPMYRPPRRVSDTKNEILLVTIVWARKIFDGITARFKKYIAWPEAVVEQIYKEVKASASTHANILINS